MYQIKKHTLKDCFQIITNLLLDHIQSIGLLKIILPRQHKISLWVKYTSSLTYKSKVILEIKSFQHFL